MTGKERCEFLRNIRKNIAEMNNLDYTPSVCTHEGWCPGYCPVCDREAADLMRQLERKEAAGCQIHIDVESIKALDTMAKERCEDYDDDDDDIVTRTMGVMVEPPDDRDTLQGEPEPPVYDEDEILMTSGTCPPPEYTEEELEEQRFFDERDIDYLHRDEVKHLCKGCMRFDTIQGKDGKPLCCAALSEHFFERALVRGICHIKKASEDDMTDLDIYNSKHDLSGGFT